MGKTDTFDALTALPEDQRTVKGIIEKTGAGRSTVQRHVSELITDGKVTRDESGALTPVMGVLDRVFPGGDADDDTPPNRVTAVPGDELHPLSGRPLRIERFDVPTAAERDEEVYKFIKSQSNAPTTKDVETYLADKGHPANAHNKSHGYISLHRLRKAERIEGIKRGREMTWITCDV